MQTSGISLLEVWTLSAPHARTTGIRTCILTSSRGDVYVHEIILKFCFRAAVFNFVCISAPSPKLYPRMAELGTLVFI